MFVTTEMNVGGVECLLVELIQRLDRSRYDPVLVCLKELGPLGEQLVDAGVRSYANLTRRSRDPRVLGRLAKVMRHEQADIVCTVGTGGDRSFWGRIAARLARVPVVISCLHSMGAPDRYELANRLLTPWTDAFIAVAERQKQFLVQEFALPAAKIHVVYNGVNLNRFVAKHAPADLRAELRLPSHAPVAGIVSKLRPEKNVQLFLRAARRVHQELPTARFLVVGDGPMRESLIELMRSLGLAGVVHFAGIRSDVDRVLRVLDVFVLSSLFEAFPLCTLEAMACGKPVVATDVGAVCEAVRSDETGFLVPSQDEGAMAHAMMRLLEDRVLAAAMGRRARQRVEARFGLDSMVRGYEDLFERLLVRKSRRVVASDESRVRYHVPPVVRSEHVESRSASVLTTSDRDRPGWRLLPAESVQDPNTSYQLLGNWPAPASPITNRRLPDDAASQTVLSSGVA